MLSSHASKSETIVFYWILNQSNQSIIWETKNRFVKYDNEVVQINYLDRRQVIAKAHMDFSRNNKYFIDLFSHI